MSAHFKWYASAEETVVPWNGRYQFPSQATKAEKLTPRIPPKNGSSFVPGQVVRLEFPAQGYVNPGNTLISMDVTLWGYGTGFGIIRFQNNIQSIFSRGRLLYGSTPLEDFIGYNQIVRNMTEWTGTTQTATYDQTSIGEGIGGVQLGQQKSTATTDHYPTGVLQVRQNLVQGLSIANVDLGGTAVVNFLQGGSRQTAGPVFKPSDAGASGSQYVTRRYTFQPAFGLFLQDKLIPTKFMASQLAFEFTLETAAGCIFVSDQTTGSGSNPNFAVQNVNLIPEILQFDASYDAMFLKGLREGGVPLKFSSWHTYQFSVSGQNLELLIQERSRSVKSIFAVQQFPTKDYERDNGATFFDTSLNGAGTLQSFQYRIGGRYFPAAPVECASGGSLLSNGAAEAHMELGKALNTIGDSRLSSPTNVTTWGIQSGNTSILPDQDYKLSYVGAGTNGASIIQDGVYEVVLNPGFCGGHQSSNFVMAINLETSNGEEVAGLNAEEQSDIALKCLYSAPQGLYKVRGVGGTSTAVMQMNVFVYYDAMIILRENNVVELVQ